MLNGALTQSFGLSEPPVHFLYSAWGVILAEVTVYTPFVLRPLLAAFSLVDQSQIEVAGLLGAKPWRIVRSVILPAALPAAIAGGSLCLLLTVNEFGIVLFIGAKGVITLPLLIYDKAIQELDYQAACAIAIGQYRALARPLLALPIRSPAAWRLTDARLVALRPFHRVAPRSFADRNHLHRAACGHSRREFGPAVERRLSDWLHSRTLRSRRRRRLGRRRAREPHHRARREPARASLRILGGARSARSRRGMEPNALGLLFFIPSAVPSVSVGLGLLVAFSQRPLLLNGTTAIVILAHFVLISAFSFGNVSAGLARLSPDYEEVASSLGARPTYRLST